MNAGNAQDRQPRTYDLICAYCGRPFTSTRPHARYCSDTHRQAQDRKVRRAKRNGH